jgi:hypothetical protein
MGLTGGRVVLQPRNFWCRTKLFVTVIIRKFTLRGDCRLSVEARSNPLQTMRTIYRTHACEWRPLSWSIHGLTRRYLISPIRLGACGNGHVYGSALGRCVDWQRMPRTGRYCSRGCISGGIGRKEGSRKGGRDIWSKSRLGSARRRPTSYSWMRRRRMGLRGRPRVLALRYTSAWETGCAVQRRWGANRGTRTGGFACLWFVLRQLCAYWPAIRGPICFRTGRGDG